MLSAPAARRRSSRFMSPVDLFELNNSSSPLIGQRASSSPASSNPFLQASSRKHHAAYDGSLTETPHLKTHVNSSQTRFLLDSPNQADSNSHSPHANSRSSLKSTSNNEFSCLSSPDLLAPVASPPVPMISALSPPIASQSTHPTVLTTPDSLGALAFSSSFARPWPKQMGENSPFRLNVTPFFQAVDLPPLFDLQSSPVVRKSLGDVTPVYSYRNDHIIDKSAPNGFSRETLADHEGKADYVEEVSRSSSPLQKQNTPFLQKLCRSPRIMQKQALSYSSSKPVHNAPPLASPFTIRNVSALARNSVTQPSPSRNSESPVKDPSTAGTKLKLFDRHTTPSGKNLSVSAASSPLSELTSTPAHSPLPFDLKVIFDDEGRKHRMKTRSAARNEALDKPNAPTPSARIIKRKCTDLEEPLGSAGICSTDDSETSPRKRIKFLDQSASPSLRSIRWIMSRGAGPGIFSKKATPKIIPNFILPAQDTTPPSHQVPADETQSMSGETRLLRKFPSSIPINQSFPNFYKKFHICSFFNPGEVAHSILIDQGGGPKPPKGCARVNSPRSPYDLYTPRFTKGVGHGKQGLCPICFESVERGGAGRQEWLSMKFSAYKCYHMQYFHGISSVTGKPFSPPIDFRTRRRTKMRCLEKEEVLEGKCHKCLKWEPVEGVKIGAVNVKELFWWKHAALCHKKLRLPGDTNIFVEDDVFLRLKAYEEETAAINDGT